MLLVVKLKKEKTQTKSSVKTREIYTLHAYLHTKAMHFWSTIAMYLREGATVCVYVYAWREEEMEGGGKKR